MGVTDVPDEYKVHRYLTAGESARFIDLRKPAPKQVEQVR